MNSFWNGPYFKVSRQHLLFLIALSVLAICIPSYADRAAAQENTSVDEAALTELDERLKRTSEAFIHGSDETLIIAEETEAFARFLHPSTRQREGIIKSLQLQARELDRLGRLDEALERIDRALDYTTDADANLTGNLLLARGLILSSQSKYGAALEHFQSALSIFERANYARGMIRALMSVGDTYFYAKQYMRSLEYSIRAQEVNTADPIMDLALLTGEAASRIMLEQYDEAYIATEKAFLIAQEMDLRNYEQLLFSYKATIELERGNFELAKEHVISAVMLADNYGVNAYINSALEVSAELDLRQGEFLRAKNTVVRIFKEVDLETTSNEYAEWHETAYKVYHELGDLENAFAHLAAFKRLDDTAKNLAADANNAILSAEFEFAQKELEIERLRTGQLESDAALVTAARRQTETIIIGLATLALGVIGFAFWRFWSVRKTQRVTQALNDELATKNAELAASNVDLEKANQAKMEFLATTSHEVRTPLNAIISLTEIILKADAFTDDDRDYLEVVNTSGKNLLHILDDILDISRLEAGRLKVNLRPLEITECVYDVGELWRNVAHEKGLDYEIDVEDGLGAYLCDDRLIRQIISNLLSNAIKFTSEGKVSLQIESADEGFAISVRDTGIGIAPAQQPAIFETFHQADNRSERTYSGTGLGLAIVKKIAEALGGEISVSSEQGEGALFTVNIPAEKCEVAEGEGAGEKGLPKADASSASPSQDELSVVRVLLAEDNPANALVVCAMLSGQVAQIDVVQNGAEAVKAVQDRTFDVVLMDKQMPVMDGVVATREIRALSTPDRDIPIIGLTAGIMPNSREDCTAAGMDEYLTKPVPFSKLRHAIIDTIKARRARAA